jgi:hypothetical protein
MSKPVFQGTIEQYQRLPEVYRNEYSPPSYPKNQTQPKTTQDLTITQKPRSQPQITPQTIQYLALQDYGQQFGVINKAYEAKRQEAIKEAVQKQQTTNQVISLQNIGEAFREYRSKTKSADVEPVSESKTVTEQETQNFVFGPRAVLERNLVSTFGPSPESITGALRGIRDEFFSDPTFNKVIAPSQPSFVNPTRSLKAGADLVIGGVKNIEGIYNDKVITAGGAVTKTGVDLVTGSMGLSLTKTTDPLGSIKAYGADVKGREGELVGEVVSDIVIGSAISKVVSKIGGVRVGSKTDDFLLKYSERYRKSQIGKLQSRPNIIGTDTYNPFTQETVFPSSNRVFSEGYQKAAEGAFSFELTPGTSAVGIKATEQLTKKSVTPTLFSYGGSIWGKTTYQNYGFKKYDPMNLNAPQQIGVTIKKTTPATLPFSPTKIGAVSPTITKSFVAGLGISSFVKTLTSTPQIQQNQEIIIQKPQSPTKDMPFVPPRIYDVEKQTEQMIVVPQIGQLPKPITYTTPEIQQDSQQNIIQFPDIQPAQIQEQQQSLIPKQISVQQTKTPTIKSTKLPTQRISYPTRTSKIGVVSFKFPRIKSESQFGLVGEEYDIKKHPVLDPKQVKSQLVFGNGGKKNKSFII